MERRQFLSGLVAAYGTGLAANAGFAATSRSRAIIDVHAHFTPPDLLTQGVSPVMSNWTIERHLASMDEAGVDRSLLSVTTPGVTTPGAAGAAIMRRCNEHAATLVAQHSRRLGHFVYVRLDDIDGALREIAHGLDQLKAHGVGLFTNYDNLWLGDPKFDPVFAELNRRRAIVYVHPTTGPCCRGLVPDVADTLIEYGTDTSRAIASYIYRGAAARFPDVRMIWSHSGGSMPYLIERFDFADRNPATKTRAPDGFRAAASRFFYDVAQASNPVSTGALRKVVPMSRIVFGTDYPFRTPLEHVTQLESGRVFNRRELGALYHGNVTRDLPELVA